MCIIFSCCSCVLPFLVVIHVYYLCLISNMVLQPSSGDVKLNPGPKCSYSNAFSVCHWNLNSISTHNYAKVFLLKAYIAIHKFGIICISETYLDSSTLSDDINLEISGYTLVRSDPPSNNQKVGVCIYYKRFLPLRILNVQYLQENVLNLKLVKKRVTFYLSRDFQNKVKMTLKLLLKNLN